MEDSLKIREIKKFIKDYIKYSKTRGRMYGSIEALETQLDVLDHIYLILEDLDDVRHDLAWGIWMMDHKRFGAKSADLIIKEMNPPDPYLELSKLRNEYEQWRKKEIRRIRNRKSKVNKKKASHRERTQKT